ncbi:MAG: hypothetical protein HY683_06645 [Chloroflexi bacterium]|nr:hypothetical protein [Chloroflexota bacterium]
MGFFAIPSAGGGFFFAAWLTMLFWGIAAPRLGLRTISYVQAMLVTIGLWLVVAPLFWAMARRMRPRRWSGA